MTPLRQGFAERALLRQGFGEQEPGGSAGFTLIEMIVVVFLLAIAMLGILSVFDASARINKNEQDVAEAQGAVRYGIFQMTRAIRMAGSGGLYVTQAVLNHRDPDLAGIAVVNSVEDNSYDNVEDDTKVTSLNGDIRVRPGTDMIEIRGVINSPLVGFDQASGCQPCDPLQGCANCIGTATLNAPAMTNTPHVNDDPANRPQFSQIDTYAAGASASNPMLVLAAFNDDIHGGCVQTIGPQLYPLYPQAPYNVGAITGPTSLASASTFGSIDFADGIAIQFNSEMPADAGAPAQARKNLRHAGILDDLIFFIDNSEPRHPALAQGTRRGSKFDVVTLADDIEDMQIAYGVDKNGDNGVSRLVLVPTPNPTPGAGVADADPNVSTQVDGDEWAPNVAGEAAYPASDFRSAGASCPRLHGVMISLVAKSHDPDPTYRSPSAFGLVTMNSPVSISPNPRTYSGPGVTRYRRRVQMLKINLRNYAYEGG